MDDDKAVSKLLAAYFNRIREEFDPLKRYDIPGSGLDHVERLPDLGQHEVLTKLRKFKKPKSMVRGDIFPQLVTIFSGFLAIPLTYRYNQISSVGQQGV